MLKRLGRLLKWRCHRRNLSRLSADRFIRQRRLGDRLHRYHLPCRQLVVESHLIVKHLLCLISVLVDANTIVIGRFRPRLLKWKSLRLLTTPHRLILFVLLPYRLLRRIVVDVGGVGAGLVD